jgi:hypothetical protein
MTAAKPARWSCPLPLRQTWQGPPPACNTRINIGREAHSYAILNSRVNSHFFAKKIEKQTCSTVSGFIFQFPAMNGTRPPDITTLCLWDLQTGFTSENWILLKLGVNFRFAVCKYAETDTSEMKTSGNRSIWVSTTEATLNLRLFKTAHPSL